MARQGQRPGAHHNAAVPPGGETPHQWRSTRALGPWDNRAAPVVIGRRSYGDYQGIAPSGDGFIGTFNPPRPYARYGPNQLFAVRFR